MEKVKKVWKRIRGLVAASGQLRVGLVLFALVLLVVLFAPQLAPFDPYDLGDDLLVPPGTAGHLLGTTNMGQDILSMLIYGSRASLAIGIVAAAISGVIGTLVGAVAGFYGGKLDKVINEVINVFLMIPSFFLVLIIVAMFGSSMVNVMFVIGLTSWPSNARMMRVQAMSIKERTYVKSAIALGESRLSVLFRYVIPNGIFPVITNTAMGIAGAILTEAGLSFLGLGDPNVISWGQMVYDGRGTMTSSWWVATFAGLAIVVTVLGVYLTCDGVNRVLDPKKNAAKG